MKNYLLIFIFYITAFSSYAQIYVTPTGGGTGSSWDSPITLSAALTQIGSGALSSPIYMQEGNYPGANIDLPSSDVVIEGGFPASLTGTSLCGQDPNNNPTVLEGQSGSSEYFNITSSDGNLTLKDLTFSGGGQLINLDGKNDGTYMLEDVTLAGTGALAGQGMFYVTAGSTGNTITMNRVEADGAGAMIYSTNVGTGGNMLTVNNSYFVNNVQGADRAGVIFIEGNDDNSNPNSATIDATTFCSNSANGAGAIQIDDATTLTVSNSTFYNNDDTSPTADDAGAIFATDASTVISSGNVYSDNDSQEQGGAIHLDNSALTSTGDVFTNNTSSFDDDGGAIFTTPGSSVTIDGSEFSNNRVSGGTAGDGGAIYINSSTLSISGDTKFIGNSASADGGAIYITGTSPTTISSPLEFSDNTASDEGGAIYSDNDLTIPSGSKFISNTSGGDGGAIIIMGSVLTSNMVEYYNNTSTGGDGGAVRTEGSKFLSTNDIFIENKTPAGVGDGAAISVSGTDLDAGVAIQINGAKFYMNMAGDNGGAIDLLNTADADVLIQNSEFLSNTSGADGGAIKAQSSDIEIIGSNFEGNTAADEGGAIMTSNETSTWLKNLTFKNNEANNDGGAVHLDGDNSDVYGTGYRHLIDNSVFFGNTAGADGNAPDGGGALYYIGVTNGGIGITNTEFYNNEATVNTLTANGGGAIFSYDNDIGLFDNNTFGGNTRNGDATTSSAGGGADINMYISDITSATDSKMQLAQVDYQDITFTSGNTFSNTAVVEPAGLTAPTTPTASTATTALTECPAKTTAQTIVGNSPANPTLTTTCAATADIVMSALNDAGEMDNPYSYTWKDPSDVEVATGTANSEGDFELMGITMVGTYTLEITDSKGCEITKTIDVVDTDCPEILPVELLYFKGQLKGDDVLLTWATASEVNNSHFMIERSHDGKSYEAIGRVYGNGTSIDVNKYDFVDGDSYAGTTYYRLMQVDYDGSFVFSNAVAVERRLGSIEVYPNPAVNFINVDYPDQNAVVYIYDVFGKVVAQENSGRINLENMVSGTYLIKIISSNGVVMDSKVFTVQK